MENKTNLSEGHRFISKKKIALIHEIKDACFFLNTKSRNNFLKKVAESAGANKIEEIQEVNFGTAFLTAEAILHKIGAEVFKPQKSNDMYFVNASKNQ